MNTASYCKNIVESNYCKRNHNKKSVDKGTNNPKNTCSSDFYSLYELARAPNSQKFYELFEQFSTKDSLIQELSKEEPTISQSVWCEIRQQFGTAYFKPEQSLQILSLGERVNRCIEDFLLEKSQFTKPVYAIEIFSQSDDGSSVDFDIESFLAKLQLFRFNIGYLPLANVEINYIETVSFKGLMDLFLQLYPEYKILFYSRADGKLTNWLERLFCNQFGFFVSSLPNLSEVQMSGSTAQMRSSKNNEYIDCIRNVVKLSLMIGKINLELGFKDSVSPEEVAWSINRFRFNKVYQSVSFACLIAKKGLHGRNSIIKIGDQILVKPKVRNPDIIKGEESKFIKAGGSKIIKTSGLLIDLKNNNPIKVTRYCTWSKDIKGNKDTSLSEIWSALALEDNRYKLINFINSSGEERSIFITKYRGETLSDLISSLSFSDKLQISLLLINKYTESYFEGKLDKWGDIKADNILVEKSEDKLIVRSIDDTTPVFSYCTYSIKTENKNPTYEQFIKLQILCLTIVFFQLFSSEATDAKLIKHMYFESKEKLSAGAIRFDSSNNPFLTLLEYAYYETLDPCTFSVNCLAIIYELSS